MPRQGRRVYVDDLQYPDLGSASRAMGWEYKSFKNRLHNGHCQYLGHIIGYVDELGLDEPVKYACMAPGVANYLAKRDKIHYGGLLGRTEVMR